MAKTLKEIQAKLLEQEAKREKGKTGNFQNNNLTYAFWNNPENSLATARFLPDEDPTNDFFWREKLTIRLPFAGIKGERDSKRTDIVVPCTNMWEDRSCGITAAIAPWWKDPSLEDMARTYYRKKSFLLQGFVTKNPNPDDTTPENPIRRFDINQELFDIIKGILLRPDLENSPTDYENGRDFDISKTIKGKWPNYTSSSWHMKERPLSADELQVIETHGLYTLNSWLPQKPDEAHKTAIMELFEASVDGEMYDPDRWSQYYKPRGFKAETSDQPTGQANQTAKTETTVPSASSILSRMKATPIVEEEVDTTPEPTPSSTSEKKTPEQILAVIRSRQQAAR